MRRVLPFLLASWFVACSSATGGSDLAPVAPSGDDSGTGDETIPTDGLELTKGLAISEIAVFQGPKVSLEVSGAKNATRRAPVVVGREGMLRVYVTPATDWVARDVVATLALTSGGAKKTLTAKMNVAKPSSDAALDSTFNFDLAADAIAADTTYSVSLKTDPGQTSGGGSEDAQYPKDGSSESMDAYDTGSVLRVKIVPIRYDADGSGRLPDTSAAQLEVYRASFQKLYPARKVEISVRDPYPWSEVISRNGTGFDTVLNAIINLRVKDGATKGIYYFGAFEPASSFGAYCSSGCVAGLSPLANNASDTWTAASVGIGYPGDMSAGTAVHEVGHGHGRQHAPCSVPDPDPKYPTGAGYTNAALGPWAWDVEGKKLVAPTSAHDMMSYCQPTWISDYSFGALATRMNAVYGGAYEILGAPKTYRIVSVAADGSLRDGGAVTSNEPTFGDARSVELELEDGSKRVTAGAFYPYDHLPGGILIVPTEGRVRALSAAVVGGRTARLDGLLAR